MERETYTFLEVARKHGYSTRSWSRHWKTYVASHKFPPPMPATQRRPRWSRQAVDNWFATRGEAAPALQADSADRDFEKRCASYVAR